jgi:putative glutamine amidotransferase
MPVLGICGGQQLLAVVLGGTLIQHIPDEVEGALEHEQSNPRNQPGHTVAIAPGTHLHRIVGADEMNVNSAHHQAVKEVSGSMVVNARSSDGVIEGIEAPRQRFCLGVQWHPEFEIDAGDIRIFAAFVDAARN